MFPTTVEKSAVQKSLEKDRLHIGGQDEKCSSKSSLWHVIVAGGIWSRDENN